MTYKLQTRVPRNKGEAAEMKAEQYEAAAEMLRHWFEQGLLHDECVAGLEHQAFALRLLAR